MSRISRLRFNIAILVLLAAPAATATPLTFSFQILPSGGAVAGPPGSTVGWGYWITNQDPTNWLVTTGVSPGSFQHGAVDTSIFDFPVLGPGQSRIQPYDPTNLLGLFQFTWDPSAPVGFVNSGNVVVSAEFWDGDPFGGGSLLATATDASAAYSVTAIAAGPSTVPEPSTVLLLASGLAAIAVMRRRAAR